MSCPNCDNQLKEVTIDSQNVLHCSNCGASFFENNAINRISSESAFQLSQDKTSDEISGKEKKCPRDQSILAPLENSESVPDSVTLLQCPVCKGIFTYPDDLIKFKKAQEAKVDYFKAWNMPLSSLKAVLVFAVVALFSIGIFSYGMFIQHGSSFTQARDIVKNVSISSSGRYVFISFKTAVPLKSEIVVKNLLTGKITARQISTTPKTLHYITMTELSLTDPLTYHIVLTDSSSKTLSTEEQKLQVSQ